MQKKKLIEKLEDLATFLTLAANDAGKESIAAKRKGQIADAHICDGEAIAYNIAFVKIDKIIREAKR